MFFLPGKPCGVSIISTQSLMETLTGLAFQSVLSLVISYFLPPYQSTVVPTSLSERTASLDLADAIRQFDQRLHHVGLRARRLQRVVHAPESPHSRHIMLRNVAMEHELTGQGLQATRPTLNHLIVNLRRPDGLHIQPV